MCFSLWNAIPLTKPFTHIQSTWNFNHGWRTQSECVGILYVFVGAGSSANEQGPTCRATGLLARQAHVRYRSFEHGSDTSSNHFLWPIVFVTVDKQEGQKEMLTPYPFDLEQSLLTSMCACRIWGSPDCKIRIPRNFPTRKGFCQHKHVINISIRIRMSSRGWSQDTKPRLIPATTAQLFWMHIVWNCKVFHFVWDKRMDRFS